MIFIAVALNKTSSNLMTPSPPTKPKIRPPQGIPSAGVPFSGEVPARLNCRSWAAPRGTGIQFVGSNVWSGALFQGIQKFAQLFRTEPFVVLPGLTNWVHVLAEFLDPPSGAPWGNFLDPFFGSGSPPTTIHCGRGAQRAFRRPRAPAATARPRPHPASRRRRLRGLTAAPMQLRRRRDAPS